MTINQYKQSDFYAKYREKYFSDVILRDVFKSDIAIQKPNEWKTYEDVYQMNIDVMKDLKNLLADKSDEKEESIFGDMIYAFYIDPDSYAIKKFGGIECSADGLLSIKRIYRMFGLTDKAISEYARYRKIPIFFFPQEKNGINMSRASIFGDKIDHTLYDIKKYYEAVNNGNIDECKLIQAYKLPKTSEWLYKIGSFENLVKWYGIEGIFVDENYEIYDIEKGDGSCITNYCNQYSWWWSDTYYNNLKKSIDKYMEKCS